jgi:KaiC/GvpD/RAD55 family RecA-like ATPase
VESTIAEFNKKIKLVVVDKISNYFRSYFSNELHEKVAAIKYVGMLLRRLARTHNVPILVNNHMTTAYREKDRPDSGLRFVPYLGETWTFMVDQRIELQYWRGETGRRRAEIIKSTYSLDPKDMQPSGYIIKVPIRCAYYPTCH